METDPNWTDVYQETGAEQLFRTKGTGFGLFLLNLILFSYVTAYGWHLVSSVVGVDSGLLDVYDWPPGYGDLIALVVVGLILWATMTNLLNIFKEYGQPPEHHSGIIDDLKIGISGGSEVDTRIYEVHSGRQVWSLPEKVWNKLVQGQHIRIQYTPVNRTVVRVAVKQLPSQSF